MEHVVVGIDSEPASQKAVDWVIHRARSTELRITLVTAFDELLANPARDINLLDETQVRIGRQLPGVTVDTRLVERSIMNELIEQSRSADLLVIGSHPRRHFLATLMGDLPVGIAAQTHCPTVIVPADWVPSTGAVVVGVDSDESSDGAVMFAAREAAAAHCSLHVLRAIGPRVTMLDSPGAAALPVIDERQEQQAVLDEWMRRIRETVSDVDIQTHIETGTAADALTHYAKPVRMVVIGTHHWSPIIGFLLDTTSRSVIRNATTVVCVVPPAETTRRRKADARPARDSFRE